MNLRRHTGHSTFVIVAVLAMASLALLVAACGGSGDDAPDDTANGGNGNGGSTPTQGQTAINRICPTPEGEEDDGFCAYVAEIDAAAQAGDFGALLDGLSGREIVCTGTDGLCEEEGETIEVLQFTRNDDGDDVRVDDARERIDEFLSRIEPEASDDIGGGALRIYAIATGITEVRDKAVVFTGIHADDDERRVALMLTVVRHEGEWLFTSVNLRDEDAEDFLAEIDKRQGAGSFWKWQLATTIDQTP